MKRYLNSTKQIKPYAEGSAGFDTDYDRENPVTKHKALSEWNQKQAHADTKVKKILADQDEFGYAHDGHYGRK